MSRSNVTQGTRRRRWFAALAGLLALCLLAWALRGLDAEQLAKSARHADPVWLLLAALLSVLPFFPRVLRWHQLLGEQDQAARAFGPLWHATLIGFMANNLLPARIGELARALSVNRLSGLPISTALTSIAVARILDAFCLLAFLAVAIAAGGLGTSGSASFPTDTHRVALVCTLALSLAVLWLLVFRSSWVELASKRVAERLLPHRFQATFATALENALSVFRGLRSVRRAGAAVAWTLAVWGINGLAFCAGFRAFAIPVDVAGAFVLQSVAGLGAALIPSPGYFGPFEAASRFVLDLRGIDPSLSAPFAILIHLVFFLPMTALGLVSLVRSPLHLREFVRARRPDL